MGGDLDGGDVGGVVHAGGTRHRIDVFCGLACFLTYPHRPFSDWRPGVRLQKVCRSALLARLFLFSSTHFEDNSYCGSFWTSVSTGNSSAICPRPRLAGRRSWSRLRGDLMTFCSLPSTLHFSFVKTFFCAWLMHDLIERHGRLYSHPACKCFTWNLHCSLRDAEYVSCSTYRSGDGVGFGFHTAK